MTTETITPDPVPPVDPAAATAAAALEADQAAMLNEGSPAPDVPEPPAPTERQHGNKGKKPWYLDRISEESEARRQAETRAQELQAMLERKNADPAAPAKVDDSAIETRARQIAQETINSEKIRGVISAGVSKFADWDQRAATLGAAGAASPDFVLDVVSVDPTNAHLILHQLADDPQKAAHLAKMDTRTRTIELVKMSMAASQTSPAPATDPKPTPAPKTVSKAPAPAPVLEPGASQAVDWRSDKATDDDFSKGWEARQRERFATRR